MTALDFFARYRVRLGYLLALVTLWLARPTLTSILLGAAVGLVGLSIRAYAAGYLHKQEVLTMTGPYARTRNPLYFGSSLLTLSTAIAMRSVIAAALLLIYFALVYSFVMSREQKELRQKHGSAFDAYASAVPLFFPRFTAAPGVAAPDADFSWVQYRKNHEYEAPLGFLFLLVVLVVIWRLRLP
jgi:protein-S-isoprenylcysteine O-methyltransferase Ste14